MKIYLDDLRPTPPGWVRAYWPDEVIHYLAQGIVTEVSLDHDLGDDTRGTGYTVIQWLEDAVTTRGFIPPVIHIHTANPAAAHKMRLGVQNIDRLLAQRSTD